MLYLMGMGQTLNKQKEEEEVDYKRKTGCWVICNLSFLITATDFLLTHNTFKSLLAKHGQGLNSVCPHKTAQTETIFTFLSCFFSHPPLTEACYGGVMYCTPPANPTQLKSLF